MFLNRRASAIGFGGERVKDIRIERPGVYVVVVQRNNAARALICLDVKVGGTDEHRILVPALSHTRYLLGAKEVPVQLCCRSNDVSLFQAHRLGFRDVPVLVRARRKDWRLQMNIGQGVTLVPLLRSFGSEARELARSMRVLQQWGFGPSTRNLNDTPILPEQTTNSDTDSSRSVPKTGGIPNFVIVLHLHFRDLWSEFEYYLRRIRRSFHLIITTTEKDDSFEENVHRSFPDADILVFENKGRDVGAFIQTALEGRLGRFDYFCKLHGKRSGTGGRRAMLGEVWRKATVLDLIGNDQQV